MPELNFKGAGAKVSQKLKGMHWKKPSKKWIRNGIICLVVVALGVGSFVVYQKVTGPSSVSAQQTGLVTRGDVSKVIEGSGTIEAIEQYEITSLAKGEIIADYVTEGQQVNEGDLLYQIDTSELDNEIEKAEASLEKSQLSNQQNQEALANLTIRAGISGVIKTLSVENGDNVQSGSQVAEIVNTDYMRLTIHFNTDDARNLWAGQSASVSMEGSFSTLTGTVERVASGSLVNDDGVSVTSVEIKVANPGGIKPDDKATALVGEYACNDSGTFSYYESETVLAEASGKAYGLNYQQGDYIEAGAVLLQLDSDTTVNNAKQGDLSVRDAELSLQKSYESLEDYSITAPISGKVIQKTSKAGDKLESGTNSTVMCIIADMSTLIFEISVDELDISSIAVGQKVEITADALEGQTFTGVVDNISIVGTASNGVTSYPVKVVVDGGEATGLIPGMNVNASIVIESREDVLRVPLSAVRRGNMVIVKDDGTDTSDNTEQTPSSGRPEGMPQMEELPDGELPEGAPQGGPDIEGSMEDAAGQASGSTEPSEEEASSQAPADTGNAAARGLEVPDGYRAVQVEVGLSDDSFTEITSGLSEGQVVLLPDTTASASSTEEGMMGGMGGGMPEGGMPGGGGMPAGGGGGMPGGGGGMPGGR